MKYMLNIDEVRTRLLVLMSAAILLMACSDDTDRQSEETAVLQIAAYTKTMESPSWPVSTRAVSIPSGYSQYTGSASIGVFLTQTPIDPNSTKMTLISYEDNAWHSMAKVVNNTSYYIYGYMPAYAACEISENTNFENGAILTFTNVPSVMSEDLSVITGVLQLEADPDHDGKAIEEGTMKAGTFAYRGKESGKNFVNLMFDHLYGALNVTLNVEPNYNTLRTIKLKELKLKTSANGTPTKSKTNLTVTLNKTDGETPINSVVFTPSGAVVDDVPFFQSATGEALETSDRSFMGYFMPDAITTFVLTSVYDVYDKNITTEHPDGNLIRKDCTAENTLEISQLFDRQTVTQRGWKYNVKLTIKPTYLYMLSEPDLDSPTVVVVN